MCVTLQNFMTAFAKGTYGKNIGDKAANIANENNAVVAVSGDNYGAGESGIVLRNGVLYSDKLFEDILIMYGDGSMETFTGAEFDIEAIKDKGLYQGWSFGPMLLQNGQVMADFNSKVNPDNPRCAIGYYEPGHYCFVLVDGRQAGYSMGLTLKEMSQLFYDMGCRVAYNLDGGQTAVMVFMGEVVNQPYKGGRDTTDIVYVAEDES